MGRPLDVPLRPRQRDLERVRDLLVRPPAFDEVEHLALAFVHQRKLLLGVFPAVARCAHGGNGTPARGARPLVCFEHNQKPGTSARTGATAAEFTLG
jgi:hypothetical protein